MDSTTTNSKSAVASALSSLLPEDLSISLYHIATPPGKTKPLFTPSPGKKPTPTTLESHFIATSHQDVLVFAIELLVYTLVASGERIVFISKADSSGYLPPPAASYSPAHAPDTRVSLLRSIAETAVRVILDGARAANPAPKITVSLFARSQAQYLFPNSAANATKHVLEDRGLIAWWCRVLDPVLQQYTAQGVKAHLLVPGFDELQTRKLFPPRKAVDEARWTCGHPFAADPERDITVREIIPHFPDDPKARFLDELDGDKSGKKSARRGKQWNSIRSVDDFWEMMSMRQECSLGRCVGFIWVVIRGEPAPPDSAEPENTHSQSDSRGTPESTQGSTQQSSPQSTQSASQLSLDTQLPIASQEDDSPTRSPKKRSRPEAISILMSPRKKKLKALDPDSLLPGSKPPLVSPAVVLDEKRYQRTIDSLLHHTDFGTLELAKDGTRKWVQRSYAVVKASDAVIKDGWDWGEVVTGTMERAAGQPKGEKAKPLGVNVLLGRRKGSVSAGLARKKDAVNVLGAGKVGGEERTPVNVLTARKREKPATAQQRAKAADLPGEGEGQVNVLGAGLVGRKPEV